jgi:hypothetical protein
MPPYEFVLLMVRWQTVSKSWIVWNKYWLNVHSREVNERSKYVEEANGHDAFFLRELKADILKL